MVVTKSWTVQIHLMEEDGRTLADAVLRPPDGEEQMRGVGRARLHTGEPDIPKIGDEVAASRALSDLAHKLLD